MFHHLLVLMTSLFMHSVIYAQTCEEVADRQARLAYRDVYTRVFADCESGLPTQCRTNLDCPSTQRCVSGRCVSLPQTCVKNCQVRWNNGECRQYGADYCGVNPVCVPRCNERFTNGDCQDFAPDACGSQPLSCVKNCKERFSDGQCRTHGKDYCGANPQCTPRCSARWPNGDCRVYISDECFG
jgi:hypothetical protein